MKNRNNNNDMIMICFIPHVFVKENMKNEIVWLRAMLKIAIARVRGICIITVQEKPNVKASK